MEELYACYLKSTGICTDSRKLFNGCLFFALKGPNFNGNLFIREALDKGAAFAVADEKIEGANDSRIIYVENGLTCLQDLAAHHRLQFNIPMIGITGSNGKTTTRELVKSVLKKKYKIHGTEGNLNNHIGLPLTLLSMPNDTQIGVFEMGANKVGDNAELCEIFKPNVGLITNLGMEHLEGFKDMEGVIRGNSELFDYLYKHQGIPFIHASDQVLMNMKKRFSNARTYGLEVDSDTSVDIVQLNPNIGLHFKGTKIISPLFGRYNAENIIAALAIGDYFGVSLQDMANAISEYVPHNQRSQWVETGMNQLILDCYNANPSSMKAAIENFMEMPGQNKVLMLGAMFELGEYEMQEHTKLAMYCHQLKNVKVILAGAAFAEPAKTLNLLWYKNADEVINAIKEQPISNSLILIKGSRGMQMEKVKELL